MAPQPVLEWLLEEEQPSVRYRTLTELLDRPDDDSAVRDARGKIPELGWAAEILAERNAPGWWVNPKSHYHPKYVSTYWKLLVLADLGLTRDLPAIRESCEHWTGMKPAQRQEPGRHLPGALHHCNVGMSARAFLRFGYVDDPRVEEGLEWIAATANPKGGWSCFGSGRTLDSWEGLAALAEYPARKRTPAMKGAIERGAEFYLERELHRQGERYAPWYRFHHPVHYYYDLLVGLEMLTALGYLDDPRLDYAIAALEKSRRPDGRWNLGPVHPDLGRSLAAQHEAWYRKHPGDRKASFALETAGAPSKMITLRALIVLRRLGRWTASSDEGARRTPGRAAPSSRVRH